MSLDFLISNVEECHKETSWIGICKHCSMIIDQNKDHTDICTNCNNIIRQNNNLWIIFDVRSLFVEYFSSYQGSKSQFTFKKLELFFIKFSNKNDGVIYSKNNCVFYINYKPEDKFKIIILCKKLLYSFKKNLLHKSVKEFVSRILESFDSISFEESRIFLLDLDLQPCTAKKMKSVHLSRKIFIENVKSDLTFFDGMD